MNTAPTLTLELVVQNRAGIHTRVALMIFKTMQQFQSEAKLSKNGLVADCRSVLDMLALGAGNGDNVTLMIQGDDAEKVKEEIVALFNNRFYEDDIVAEKDEIPPEFDS